MKCPYCGHLDHRVLDSRVGRDGHSIRRRRECTGCEKRFTTFEVPEVQQIWVTKRSGEREEFDREKLLRGFAIACRKRPVTSDDLEDAVDRVILSIQQQGNKDVSSDQIGRLSLDELSELDPVAFIRFASVYREFESIDEFVKLAQDVQAGKGI